MMIYSNPKTKEYYTMSNKIENSEEVEVLSAPTHADYQRPAQPANPIEAVKLFLHEKLGESAGNETLRKMSGWQVVKLAEDLAKGITPNFESPEFADPNHVELLQAPTFEDYMK